MDLSLPTNTDPESLVQQFSRRFSGRFRSSSSRVVDVENLERAASRHYEENESSFGQVEVVDDGEVPHIYTTPTALSVHLQKSNIANDLELGREAGNNGLTSIEKLKPQRTSKVTDGNGGPTLRFKKLILEHSWWSTYQLLFLISFVLNLAGLILATTGHFPYAKSRAAIFSVGNILMVVLVRSEVFLRVLFWVILNVLGHVWIPVWIKYAVTTTLQSVGGIHSGCGCSSIMWLVYAIVQGVPTHADRSISVFSIAVVILFLLLLSILAAFPVARQTHHNIFENTHRFAGWTSLALVWAYIVLSAFWNPASHSHQINAAGRKRLVKMEILWLTAATTIMIIIPWFTVRKLPVETFVPPSKLNCLIKFQGGVGAGLLIRVSRSPLSEWHAFGAISDGKSTRTVMAAVAGDFTKSLVDNPPTTLWTRTLHFAGLPYVSRLFERGVLIATGSGIAVFLSLLLQPSRCDLHAIWIAKNIRSTYGEDMWKVVSNIPKRNITIFDTAISGRPKTKELVVAKAKEWNAQVVFVTSNPKGTSDMVSACRKAGFPSFGPIWDS